VQGIDLAVALAALLLQHAPGEIQRPHERLPQIFVPDEVTFDVADDAAKRGLELRKLLLARLNYAQGGR
jgi:hypothetical protein